jgi:hypothetical protein
VHLNEVFEGALLVGRQSNAHPVLQKLPGPPNTQDKTSVMSVEGISGWHGPGLKAIAFTADFSAGLFQKLRQLLGI